MVACMHMLIESTSDWYEHAMDDQDTDYAFSCIFADCSRVMHVILQMTYDQQVCLDEQSVPSQNKKDLFELAKLFQKSMNQTVFALDLV